MVVFNGETAEEPVVSSAYLGRFRDLEVRVVALDTLMMHPDKISRYGEHSAFLCCDCFCVFLF